MIQNQELIAKIKELKKIQPDEKWVGFCRSQIISRIQEEKKLTPGFGDIFHTLLYRPAFAVFSIVFVFAVLGIAAAITAKSSLPGDHTYPLKITYEKAQTSLVLNEASRAKLGAEISGRRAEELSEIVKQSSPEMEQRTQMAVEQIASQLSTAQKDIPKLREKIADMSGNDSQKIVEAAKAVRESAMKIEGALAEARDNLSENTALASKISDISDIAGKTGAEASAIIQIIENIEVSAPDISTGNQNTSEQSSVLPNNTETLATQTTTPAVAE